jgi:ABC-type uncharacterized transport system permease subunit
MLGMSLLASVVHGGATPLVVIIGLALIVVGVVMLLRRSLMLGALAIVVGILLGGLSVF